ETGGRNRRHGARGRRLMRVRVGSVGDVTLPDTLLKNLRNVHGERVDPWLDTLPGTLAAVLDELGARIVPGDAGLSYHLVVFARRASGEDIAVKCTVPNDEQPPEAAGVHALSEAGVGPRLIRSDLGRGVLVMERIVPGRWLPTHMPTLAEDAENIRTVAALAARMQREVDVAPWREELVSVRRYSSALDMPDPASVFWTLHRGIIDEARA